MVEPFPALKNDEVPFTAEVIGNFNISKFFYSVLVTTPLCGGFTVVGQ